nr:hypothetical protein GCM10017611_68540 [Rhodococcus wratislaviensis]
MRYNLDSRKCEASHITVTEVHTNRVHRNRGHDEKGRARMTTASMIPASSIPSRPPVRRSGGMSTEEIKARIEAMFADDRRRPVHQTGPR